MKMMKILFFGGPLLLTLMSPEAFIWAADAQKANALKLFGFEYKLPEQAGHYRFKMHFTKDDAHANFFVDSSTEKNQRVTMQGARVTEQKGDIKDKINELQETPLDEIWCTDFLQFVGTDLVLAPSKVGELTYSFSPIPTENDDEEDRTFLSNMIAFITINDATGALLRFEMRNKHPFKPMLLAKITHFEMLAVCQPYINGLYFISEFKTEIAGRFAFSSFKESESWSISQFEQLK